VRPVNKYPLIRKHSDRFSITELCQYFEVSRSGYYSWLKNEEVRKQREQHDEMLCRLIQECQKKTDKTYGYRRVGMWIRREYGMCINHKTILRLMNKYGLLSEVRRQRPSYFKQQRQNQYEDLLSRNFTATAPNQKWCADISCIHTKKGNLYLSIVKDLYDNFIVAFEMSTAQDNALVLRTLKKAKKEITAGLVLHSDQGFPYTSQRYLQQTQEYCIIPSMSKPGSPLDNACAENFFGILKAECLYRHQPQTILEAKTLIQNYIHFYNYQRVQGKNMLTPFEKRRQHTEASQASGS
jgi:putative transposase